MFGFWTDSETGEVFDGDEWPSAALLPGLIYREAWPFERGLTEAQEKFLERVQRRENEESERWGRW